MKRNLKAAFLSLMTLAMAVPLLPVHAQVSGPLGARSRQPSLGSIEIDVNMVLVNVGVNDAGGHVVANLGKKNFHLFEDNVEQEILTFSREDVPASIGLLFDTSASMADKMDAAREAVGQFLRKSNPDDEFFMISFDNRPELDGRFTSNIEQLQQKTKSLKPRGRTSLLDAIHLGLEQMKSARHERHVLLVISDGGDNHSRHHLTEIRNLLQESDCQLYALGIFDPNDMKRTAEEHDGPGLLSDLGEMTGGHLYQAANLNELVELSGTIGTELRNQYILGYKPGDPRHDGRWRRIKVTLSPSAEQPSLTARARTGYYGPRD